jgi:hypothetical protein
MSDPTPEQLDVLHKEADLRIKEKQEALLQQQLAESKAKMQEAQLPSWKRQGSFNTGLSVFAAVVTACGGIMSAIMKSQVDKSAQSIEVTKTKLEEGRLQIDASRRDMEQVRVTIDESRRDMEQVRLQIDKSKAEVKNAGHSIANQTATQEGSYRYVKEIMDRIQRMEQLHEKIQKGGKSLEMRTILPSLKIITEASTSNTRESAAATRGFILVKLALLMGQHHEAAGLDSKLDYLDEWIKFAATDTDATRATAIMALSTIGRLAIAENKEELFEKVINAIQKIESIVFRKEKDNLLYLNEIANAKFALCDYGRFGYRIGIDPLVSPISGWKCSETVAKWEGALVDAVKLNEELRNEINNDASQDSMRAKAVCIETQRLANGAKREDVNSLLPKDAKALNPQNSIQLAIQGASVVAPLSEKLIEATDSALRLEILNIFRKMPQPLLMEDKAVGIVIGQLVNSDKAVRIAAAEFLMGCWHPQTVNLIYGRLAPKVDAIMQAPLDKSKVIPVPKDPKIDPDFTNSKTRSAVEDGLFVHYGGLIIGTWARTLRDTIPGPKSDKDPGRPMNAAALAKVTQWRDRLDNNDYNTSRDNWEVTISLLNSLITLEATRKDMLVKEKELAELAERAVEKAVPASPPSQ